LEHQHQKFAQYVVIQKHILKSKLKIIKKHSLESTPIAPDVNSPGNGMYVSPIWKQEYRASFISPKKQKAQAKISMIKDGKVFEAGEVKIWKCRNCGHIVVGTSAPEVCPVSFISPKKQKAQAKISMKWKSGKKEP